MIYKNILVLTDNLIMYKRFPELLKKAKVRGVTFVYRYSSKNEAFKKIFSKCKVFLPLDVRKDTNGIANKYDLLISLHCKQIFPEALLRKITCINIHPGYNPYNRGWSPQVFSIINGKPLGATIHEIDSSIDHGAIIDQRKVKINSWDTSLSAYKKVLRAEENLIVNNIQAIVNGTYRTRPPSEEGNLNYLKDFMDLHELNLKRRDTVENTLNHLRALTHGSYKNAYFIDREGNKVFVKLHLSKEKH